MYQPMLQSEYQAIINRQRRLPDQISVTRKKLAMLLTEAERNGMLSELLHDEFNGDMIAMEHYRMREYSVAGVTEGLI